MEKPEKVAKTPCEPRYLRMLKELSEISLTDWETGFVEKSLRFAPQYGLSEKQRQQIDRIYDERMENSSTILKGQFIKAEKTEDQQLYSILHNQHPIGEPIGIQAARRIVPWLNENWEALRKVLGMNFVQPVETGEYTPPEPDGSPADEFGPLDENVPF